VRGTAVRLTTRGSWNSRVTAAARAVRSRRASRHGPGGPDADCAPRPGPGPGPPKRRVRPRPRAASPTRPSPDASQPAASPHRPAGRGPDPGRRPSPSARGYRPSPSARGYQPSPPGLRRPTTRRREPHREGPHRTRDRPRRQAPRAPRRPDQARVPLSRRPRSPPAFGRPEPAPETTLGAGWGAGAAVALPPW
jgi:hypothetical protein